MVSVVLLVVVYVVVLVVTPRDCGTDKDIDVENPSVLEDARDAAKRASSCPIGHVGHFGCALGTESVPARHNEQLGMRFAAYQTTVVNNTRNRTSDGYCYRRVPQSLCELLVQILTHAGSPSKMHVSVLNPLGDVISVETAVLANERNFVLRRALWHVPVNKHITIRQRLEGARM